MTLSTSTNRLPIKQSSSHHAVRRHGVSRVASMSLVALGLFLAPSLAPLPAYAQRTDTGISMARGFADIVDKVKPSVVSIFVTGGGNKSAAAGQKGPAPRGGGRGGLPDSIPGLPDDHPLNELFKNLPRGGAVPPPSLAQGSGFVIAEDGYVVTNNHVIDGAGKIQVQFDDQTKYEADLVGTDARTDIALLKIKDGKKFPSVKFATKESRVGDFVLAVGNPFGFGGTVTSGIVSALARDVGSGPYDYLQIDAAVNRGNSGGPTFNLDGEVIGVNTAIYSPSGGNVGIAFAVPAKTVTEVIAQLRSSGSVSRGWLGVKIQNVDEDTAGALGLGDQKGALINEVSVGGPAAAAGLKNGDTILSVNGEKINDSRDLARKVAGFAPNTSVDVKVLRGGKEQQVAVKLGDFKDASGAPKVEPAKAAAAIEQSKLGVSFATGAAQKAIKDGVLIADVDATSDAAQKGLKSGDVILEIANLPVASADDVAKGIADAEKLGRKAVLLKVRSGEQSRYVGIQFKKG
jgi:serine protease Do